MNINCKLTEKQVKAIREEYAEGGTYGSMNINCMLCGGFFTLGNYEVCDGCSRPAHLEICGQLEPVYREGEIYIYFFCGRCNNEEWEAQ